MGGDNAQTADWQRTWGPLIVAIATVVLSFLAQKWGVPIAPAPPTQQTVPQIVVLQVPQSTPYTMGKASP